MYTLHKSTRLALYALVEMCRRGGEPMTVLSFAESHGVTTNHVAKVLQRLCRAGFVEGQRGAKGGYLLCRDAAEITMFEVVQEFEGKPRSECVLRDKNLGCTVRTCNIHGVLTDIEQFAVTRLSGTAIADLAHGPLGPPKPGKAPAAQRRKRLPVRA